MKFDEYSSDHTTMSTSSHSTSLFDELNFMTNLQRQEAFDGDGGVGKGGGRKDEIVNANDRFRDEQSQKEMISPKRTTATRQQQRQRGSISGLGNSSNNGRGMKRMGSLPNLAAAAQNESPGSSSRDGRSVGGVGRGGGRGEENRNPSRANSDMQRSSPRGRKGVTRASSARGLGLTVKSKAAAAAESSAPETTNGMKRSNRERRSGTSTNDGYGSTTRDGHHRPSNHRDGNNRRRSGSAKRLDSCSSRRGSENSVDFDKSTSSMDCITNGGVGQQQQSRRPTSSSSRRTSGMRRSRSKSRLKDYDDSGEFSSPRDLRGKSQREQLTPSNGDGGGGTGSVGSPSVQGKPDFEKLWDAGNNTNVGGPDAGLANFMNREASKPQSSPADLHSVVSDTISTVDEKSLASNDNGKRKTKLEKIHELQAKCGRYKQEWIQASKEKRESKKELQLRMLEVISLRKEVDAHMSETDILRKKLDDALTQIDVTQQEQRKERTEFSTAAKELAQSRIDHAKALNETREHREEIDNMQTELRDKEQKIEKLLDDLDDADQKMDDLKADVKFAETEIMKLEDKVQTMEQELIMYRSATDKDGKQGSDADDNIRKVREEMEQKLHEERERRLEDKQQKLDEKIQQFEDEKMQNAMKLKERELELEQQKKDAALKQKERDQERRQMDDDINQRLKQLEDDNTVLQGRLKSEQLDASVRLKKKDETLGSLQKELLGTKEELKQLESDPDGMLSLQTQIMAGKNENLAVLDELNEAQKRNGMLEEEIDDLQSGNAELRSEMENLMNQVKEVKKSSDLYKSKADEWRKKASEWTQKAFLYKEKAEEWEKAAKELNPDGSQSNPGSGRAAPPADPQALFLQAAFEKKKQENMEKAAAGTGTWSRWGGLFSKQSEDGGGGDNPGDKVHDLEAKNTEQLETIKNLRSELVKIQTFHKEQMYAAQQQMKQMEEERRLIELKNTNLQKELDLARKLGDVAADSETT